MRKETQSDPSPDNPQSEEDSILFVITAPSGAGKSSICWAVIERVQGLAFSVSHTTRAPRQHERDGVDYYFVDDETFDRMIREDRFLEWAEVYGRRYGTSRDEVERARQNGIDLLIEIDRQGARNIRAGFPEAVGVFLMPPSFRSLNERLMKRGSESAEEINKRLAIAADETKDYPLFDYAVVNDDFDKAVAMLEAIIWAERNKVKHQEKALHKIMSGIRKEQAPE